MVSDNCFGIGFAFTYRRPRRLSVMMLHKSDTKTLLFLKRGSLLEHVVPGYRWGRKVSQEELISQTVVLRNMQSRECMFLTKKQLPKFVAKHEATAGVEHVREREKK